MGDLDFGVARTPHAPVASSGHETSNQGTDDLRERRRHAGARVRDGGRRGRREPLPDHLDETDQPEGPERTEEAGRAGEGRGRGAGRTGGSRRARRGERRTAGAEGKQGVPGEPGPEGRHEGLPAGHPEQNVATAGADIEHAAKRWCSQAGPFTITATATKEASGSSARCPDLPRKVEAASRLRRNRRRRRRSGKDRRTARSRKRSKRRTPQSEDTKPPSPVERRPVLSPEQAGAIALDGAANNAVSLGDKASPACYFSGTVTERHRLAAGRAGRVGPKEKR